MLEAPALLTETYIVDSAPMPKDLEPRVQSAEERLNRLGERIATVEGRLVPPALKNGLSLQNALLGFFLTAAFAYAAWAGNKLVGLDREVGEIKIIVIPQSLQQASVSPTDSVSIAQASSALKAATKSNIALPRQLITEVGQRFIDASTENEDAWSIAIQLMGYRSKLNSHLPLPASLADRQCLFVPGNVVGVKVIDSYVHDCMQRLDRIEWHNVVFNNVIVVYDGGFTTLDRVQFKNCEFRIKLNSPGQKLGETLLAANNAVTTSLP
jgi:hypothetical protein